MGQNGKTEGRVDTMLLKAIKNKLKEIHVYGDINRPLHAYEAIGDNFPSIEAKPDSELKIEIIREETKDAIVISFLLHIKGHIIGYVSAEYWKRFVLYQWHMALIKIRKDSRGKGLGTMLMKKLQEYFDGQLILTNIVNKKLIEWYEKLGWRIVGQNKDSYGNLVFGNKGRKSIGIIYGDNQDKE